MRLELWDTTEVYFLDGFCRGNQTEKIKGHLDLSRGYHWLHSVPNHLLVV